MPNVIRLPGHQSEPFEVTVVVPPSSLPTEVTATVWTDAEWDRLDRHARDRRAIRIEGVGWIAMRAELRP